MKPAHYILTLSCQDQAGIVATVSQLIAKHQGWILDAKQHASSSGLFFMRVEIVADSFDAQRSAFEQALSAIAAPMSMNWALHDTRQRQRIMLLCSKQEHCMYDLLSRWFSQDLDFDIPCIISNHTVLEFLADAHQIPFYHLPITPENKVSAYRKIEELADQYQIDLVVLARYMQVLDAPFCQRYAGRIINIHHSFLPSFAGAKPYHQAFERGVKLIGATCHYVTTELDEGPIIEQDVLRINHSNTIEELVRYGKNIEKVVLARGIQYHLERRVLIDGNKTVVLI